MQNLSKTKIIIIGLISGIFIGFINGFFGGGGGMLVVPILSFLFLLPEKEAHATAIFIILPLCVISSVIYIIQGSIDWLQLLYSSIGFIIGGVLGALLLKKMNNKVLKIIFSLVMIGAGIKLFF